MTKHVVLLVVLVVLAFLLSCCTTAFAADLFVATTGNDSTGDGSIGNPFASVSHAVFSHAQPGDTVQVRAGTYTAGQAINGDGYCAIQAPDHLVIGGTAGAPITIRSYDGDFTAIFTGGFSMVRCKYLTLTGLDLSIPAGGHPVRVTSGCQDDFADPVRRSHNIVITNCKIHDGGSTSGQAKMQQCDYITIQDCEFYNLGAGGMTVDGVWNTHSTYRRNYFHQTSGGGFAKGGSQYDVFDGNVVVDPWGANAYGFLPGGCTLDWASDPTLNHQSYYTVIRNNIVVGMGRGAIGWWGAAYAHVYNNLFKDCATGSSSYSYITAILATQSCLFSNSSDHLYTYNNIFYDSDGNMRPYGWKLSGGGSGDMSDWQSGYNSFYNNGQSLIHESDTPDPTTETGATYGDPHLTMSGGTPTTWQGWVDYFRPAWDSQSNAMLKDHGTSAAGGAPCPAVVKDIEGNPRPKDSGWDIGPYEYQGTTVAPVAEFSATAPLVLGQQLWGTSPATFNFTDASSGGPTSWSWSFGDSTTSTEQNPSHTYSSYGQYTVALTAYNSAGNDTETKTNYLTVKPLDANFTFTPPGGAVPLVVAFTDTSTNSPTSWSWTFGDSGSSTAQNPSHTYTSAGYYTVTLVATNANGNDTETKTNCITACDETLVYPTSYSMDNGNQHVVSGSLSDLQADDGTCLDVACNTIQLGGCTPPAGAYSYNIYYFCNSGYTADQVYGIKLEYKARSSVADDPDCHRVFLNDWENTGCPPNPFPNTFTWTTAERLGNAANYMDSSGVLHFHICGSRGGAAYDILADVVRWRLYLKPGLNMPPVADFVGNPTSGYMPLAVNFTDTSSNTPTSWSWTFGDSSTSTAHNPSHTYSTDGSYTVSLTATNAYGNDSETKNNCITVSLPVPVANFTGNPTTGVAPLAVNFTDTTINTPTSWAWTFGDSGTSTLQNPSHTYNSVGFYTVALTATNSYGNDTETKTNYINATIAPPVADFSGTPTTGVAPLAVSFTDSSTGSPTSWSWAFGDSSTSTAQNPSHTYNTAGSYTVILTATNSGGSDGETKTNYITATAQPPVANFSGSPTSGVAPLAVTFTDTSTNTPTAWSWTFGDTGTSTVQNPSHTYSSGTYTVSLTATNSGGSDGETKTDYITATNGGVVTVVPDSGNPGGGCSTISGGLSDVYTENAVYWVTRCNTSHSYSMYFYVHPGYPPSQISSLQIQDKLHNSRSDTPNFTFMMLRPVPQNWLSMYSGLWTTSDQWMNYTTTDPATYMDANGMITLMTCGCPTTGNNNDYDVSWDVVRINVTVLGSAPVADFSGTPTSGYVPLAVNFTDASTNTPTSWSWSFGDSNTSTVQNPSHTYTGAGDYTVALTATNSYGNDTETKTNYISATYVPAPVADFSGTPTSGAYPLAVNFTDASTNTPTSWSWTFGDSGTSTAQNPSHTYNSAGNFTVSLTAANAGGSDGETKTNYITVTVPAPVADFSGTPTTGTAPLAVNFTDASTNTPTSWSWAFGDSAASTVQNPSHSYAVGTYTVSLTATNAGGSDGETKTDYITATVPPPVADFTANQTVGLAGLAVNFTDTSTNTPTSWSWTFGDSNTSTAQNPSHTYNAVGYYTVTLTATNAGGSDGETKTDFITVCTEVTLFPDSMSQFVWCGPVVAGSLADVRTDNQLYHTTYCDRVTKANDGRRYYYPSSYAAANVARVALEYQWHGTATDTPIYQINILKQGPGGPGDVIPENLIYHTLPTSDTWDTWYSDSPATYIRDDNSVWLDSCGCPQNGNAFYTYIDVARVKLWIKPGTTISAPTASFTGTPTTGYVPLSVTFTDSSTGSPAFWAWDFGDGASATDQSPSHSYSTAGTYSVTLTVNNGYGSNSLTRSNYITANDLPPAPVANFSGTPTAGNAPLAVSFTDSSTNTPTAWSWDFGDSNTSTVQNPSHTYAAGTYTVSLTATNAGGSDGETKTNYITVTVAPPTFVAAGSVASGTGTITPALPSGIASNDILLLFLETANQAISISNQNGGTWTQATNSPQGYGTAGASNATRLTVFWSRYNGTQGAPTASDSGNHQIGRIIAIRGATTSGDPCNVTAGGTESTVDTSGAIPGATTTVDNTLVVAAIATSLPDTNGTSNFSSWTNADLSSVSERTDNTRSSGNGGGLGVATGVKATAGAYTTTSVTCGTASTKAMMSIAIKP